MNDLNRYLIEFLPGIWLSNTISLNDNFLQQKKIHIMVDCDKEMNFFESAENYIESIKKEIKKTNHMNLYQYLLNSTEKIHKTILSGKSLLIYDLHATRKGPILLIAYLMRYAHFTPIQIIDSFLSKSKIPLNINEDYQIAIKIFYKKMQETNNI
jgi:hypothetical protein